MTPLLTFPPCLMIRSTPTAILVSKFTSHYRNDEAAARRSLAGQTAEMFMANIRELWRTGAWQHYRHALGEFEWREHEFDYFLAPS